MNVLNFKKSKKGIIVTSLIAACIFATGFASNMTTLAMINESDSETTRIFDTPTIINDPIPISEFEEMIEGFRNIPAIFQTDELFAMLEELLAESAREGRDYVIIDMEDLMALEGSFSINANDFDLEDFHLFDINGFDLEDFHLFDINGFDLEDFHLFDINDFGYSLEDVHLFGSDLDINDFLGMTREEAVAHVRDQLIENGYMTREQAESLESLPFD